MPIPGSNDDGTMIADLAQFDLLNEIAEAKQQKPWASGIHSRTLFKKADLRVVLISMEAGARLKEHHADGTSSIYMLKGHIRYTTQGKVYDLRAGSLFTLGASIKHGVEALEESGFLLTLSWPSDRQLHDMPHRGYGKWIERIEFIESEKTVGLGEGGRNEDDEYFDLLPNI